MSAAAVIVIHRNAGPPVGRPSGYESDVYDTRMSNLISPYKAVDRWFYVLFLPLAWAGCSILHSRHPGDEYAMYVISSLPGSWVLLVFHVGDIHSLQIPLLVAVVGGLVMAVVGGLLVWLRVKKVLWAGLFGACALAILLLTLSSFPSIERALAKNGSWWAYICSAIEVGMYCAAMLSVVATAIGRLWHRIKSK